MADPICTFVFSIIVVFTTVKIMKESILVLLDGVPTNVAVKKLEKELSCIQGVRYVFNSISLLISINYELNIKNNIITILLTLSSSIHHLNVWSLTIDWNIMSVHLIVDNLAETDEILQAATTIARKGFDIKHTTIQIEKINEFTAINEFVNYSKEPLDDNINNMIM